MNNEEEIIESDLELYRKITLQPHPASFSCSQGRYFQLQLNGASWFHGRFH